MKKLMFALVAAAAACVMADGIESQTVGFQSYDASATDDMSTIGIAFSNIGAVGGSFTISDKIFSRDAEDSDQILLFDYDNYNLISYTYYDGAGWYVTWADGTEEPVDGGEITVPKGMVLWFLPVTTDTETKVSGEVAAGGTVNLTFTPGGAEGDCFMFVNPFPIDTKFSDLTTFCEDGDQFLLFDFANYNLISYTFYDGAGWYVTDAFGDETPAAETDVAIPAGQGAYFLPGDERTWTVTYNY